MITLVLLLVPHEPVRSVVQLIIGIKVLVDLISGVLALMEDDVSNEDLSEEVSLLLDLLPSQEHVQVPEDTGPILHVGVACGHVHGATEALVVNEHDLLMVPGETGPGTEPYQVSPALGDGVVDDHFAPSGLALPYEFSLSPLVEIIHD
jgi:hypothetical protein